MKISLHGALSEVTPAVKSALMLCVKQSHLLRWAKPAVFSLVLASSAANAELQGTMFYEPARQHGIDPALLYAVALAESANAEAGMLQPWPYTLRVLTEPGHYAPTRDDAVKVLQGYMHSHQSIDVGIMQVNTRWNGHRVDRIEDLLDPHVGLRVGAEILKEAIDSAPGDLILGVGRYHNWQDEARARNYGERVLAIYRNIKSIIGGAP